MARRAQRGTSSQGRGWCYGPARLSDKEGAGRAGSKRRGVAVPIASATKGGGQNCLVVEGAARRREGACGRAEARKCSSGMESPEAGRRRPETRPAREVRGKRDRKRRSQGPMITLMFGV
jgi:hypothetical protein